MSYDRRPRTTSYDRRIASGSSAKGDTIYIVNLQGELEYRHDATQLVLTAPAFLPAAEVIACLNAVKVPAMLNGSSEGTSKVIAVGTLLSLPTGSTLSSIDLLVHPNHFFSAGPERALETAPDTHREILFSVRKDPMEIGIGDKPATMTDFGYNAEMWDATSRDVLDWLLAQWLVDRVHEVRPRNHWIDDERILSLQAIIARVREQARQRR